MRLADTKFVSLAVIDEKIIDDTCEPCTPVRATLRTCLLLALLACFAVAQENNAVLRGQAVDGSGNAIPGAILQWSAVGLASNGTGYSDAQGNFGFELPVLRGTVTVQISATANLYLPTQVSAQVTAGNTTNISVVMSLRPRTQLATVSGTLKDAKTHTPIPSARISIRGAVAVLSTQTNANGKFVFKKIGFNPNLTIRAETLEAPCVATTDFPLSVNSTPVVAPLTAPLVISHSPHCPDNDGFAHQTEAVRAPSVSIDDTLQWKQADILSIVTNPSTNAWNAGHVNAILRQAPGVGLIVASDEGGVWLVSENPGKSAITPSFGWPSINMNSLSYGPDGPGHVYGGMWQNANSPGMLWETDTSTGFPLLNWLPVSPQPPCHNIQQILVIAEVRRIVLACSEGLWWSNIPAMPSVHGAYSWKNALPLSVSSHAFSGVAKGTGWVVGSQLEGSIVASLWGDGKTTHPLYTGAWKNGQLVLTAASVQSPANPIFKRTSVASCPNDPNLMYAVEADSQDSHMNAVFRSVTGGTTWNLVTLPTNAEIQGYYNNAISVSGDCSIVAVGWNSTYLSFDSGATWSRLTDVPGYNNLHPDIHALTFDPADPATLFIGSDGGVASASGLASNTMPVFESDWSRSILNLQFYPGAASTSFDGFVSGATQDNGVIYADVPGSAWQHVTDCGCDGGQALFATPLGLTPGEDLLIEREWGAPNFPLDGEIATTGFVPFKGQKDIPLVPPINGSSTVNSEIAQAVRAPGGFANAKGEAMIAVDGGGVTSSGGGIFLFGLFSMPDGSDLHWELLGQVPGGQNISAVAPTVNGSNVFAGTDQGNIYRFDAPYTAPPLQLTINPPEAGPGRVSGLTAFFSTVAWASYNFRYSNSGYVMQYNGSSWNQSGNGMLPTNLPFYSIAARDLNTIFVSSGAAVYDTRNSGTSWSIANIGLPANLTSFNYLYYLPFSPSGKNGLYLYTHGRSLWVTPVP